MLDAPPLRQAGRLQRVDEAPPPRDLRAMWELLLIKVSVLHGQAHTAWDWVLPMRDGAMDSLSPGRIYGNVDGDQVSPSYELRRAAGRRTVL